MLMESKGREFWWNSSVEKERNHWVVLYWSMDWCSCFVESFLIEIHWEDEWIVGGGNQIFYWIYYSVLYTPSHNTLTSQLLSFHQSHKLDMWKI